MQNRRLEERDPNSFATIAFLPESLTKKDFDNTPEINTNEFPDIDMYSKKLLEGIKDTRDSQYLSNSTKSSEESQNLEESTKSLQPSKKRKRERSLRVKRNKSSNVQDLPSSTIKPQNNQHEECIENKTGRKYPKKEYYRTKMIRAWKNSLKKKGANFKLLLDHYSKSDKDVLDKAASTINGPATEGKYRADKKESKHKTFNNSHVIELFKSNATRESFEIFVGEYFEALMNCQLKCENNQHSPLCMSETYKRLEENFSFTCCMVSAHSPDCLKKWKDLEIYTYTGLILQPIKDP